MDSTFITPENYKTRLRQLVSDEDSLDVAVAFWGHSAQKLIHPDESKPIRIICNLRTGSTNPQVIEHFLELSARLDRNVQVRQCDRLHAKVILGANQAVIGSANISANGLGLEDEDSAHWLEAGMHIRERTELGAMQSWFDALWDSVHVRAIDDSDIAAAYLAWRRNRKPMLEVNSGREDYFSLADFTASSLRWEKVYALIYRHKNTPEARSKLKAIESEVGNDKGDVKTGIKLWGYENWPDFPTDVEAEYVDIRWGPMKGVSVFGPCRLLGQQASIQYANSFVGTLDIANPVQTLLGTPFGTKAKRAMEMQLKTCMQEIWDTTGDGDDVRVVHLAELAEILEKAAGRAEASDDVEEPGPVVHPSDLTVGQRDSKLPVGGTFNGQDAVGVLESLSKYVVLHEKDKKNKFWSYKIRTRRGIEFAFDPKTKRGLYVRVERELPNLPGIVDIKHILADSKSTALNRVFSGGHHRAVYSATIETESALRAFVDYYFTL
ncbi:phospholipase D family protein [Pseudomonas laurylsulfativorans]|uniref:phospholipase D family protein n=1 Tax=Pseudomonas laurylsulfativorans TaxID=1943631 RepID=UPI0013FE014E|nr:phospholipase D family protein [Pseudomonas laurylsulfativorans]